MRPRPTDGSDDDTLHELHFDEELFTVGVGGNPEWTQPTLRLGYGSFVTPSTVYDYDVRTRELPLRKQQPVLGDVRPGAVRAAPGVGDGEGRDAHPDLARLPHATW